MKKLFALLSVVVLLISCQSSDKLALLENLRKQHDELTAKIAALEKELAASDTSLKNIKQKLVETKVVQPELYAHYIEIQGKVESDQNIIITPNAAGTIKAVYVREGDAVKPGQVLAEIDDQILRQGIEELKTGLDLAKQLYEKQENLWKQNIGSEVQYLQVKNQKESLEKKLKTMMEQLELYKLKSSIYGTVDEVMIKIGQAAAPGVPSFRVVNNNQLKIKAEVAERFSKSVKEGSPVIVYLNDINKEINGTISYKGKSINIMNRTFGIIVNINGSDDILPNMSAVVKIKDYENPEAIVIPINMTQLSEEGTYAYVAATQNGKMTAEKKIIVPGSVYNGKMEILSGLKSGDILITTGLDDITNGVAIKTNK
jgi:RND family efflux transporter MFP subunit